ARRILVESAWSYRFPARQTAHMKRKMAGASPEAKAIAWKAQKRSEEHTSELQSRFDLVCRLLLAIQTLACTEAVLARSSDVGAHLAAVACTIRRPAIATLFPYTTLFRSMRGVSSSSRPGVIASQPARRHT